MIKEKIESKFPKAVRYYFDIKFLTSQPIHKWTKIFHLIRKSKSQLRQDLFALCELGFKEGGYFVEFGATNGIDLSNTHLLEHQFAWFGLLAEPAKIWHNDLHVNRPSSVIEELCVWINSDSFLEFYETNEPELSTIKSYGLTTSDQTKFLKNRSYRVETISLIDMLRKHKAPKYIDYLSIDTEGSEFDILNSFNFSEYSFGVITCEHNYGPNRKAIYDLLTQNGYSRRYENISRFDDWYIKD